MTDANDAAAQALQATEKLQQVLALFAPNVTNVQIKTVNQHPHEIQLIDYRATLSDGSAVYAPRITFRLGLRALSRRSRRRIGRCDRSVGV
jgi:hypothetical protein